MAQSFAEYSFRIGILTVGSKGAITVSAPIFSKNKELRLIIQKCHIKSKMGRQSTFRPSRNNVFELKAGAMMRFSFSFSTSDINSYGDGTKLEIEILNETDNNIVTANYTYSGTTGWSLKEVTDIPYVNEEPDEEPDVYDDIEDFEPDEELFNDDLTEEDDELNFPAQSNNHQIGKWINENVDWANITPEEMMKIRNLGRKSPEEILAKLKELGLELKPSQKDEERETEGESGSENAFVDWDALSPVERIEKKTNLDELGSKELEGFCCHYCVKSGNDNGYVLIEQVNVDLAEFIEDEFVWSEFQKVIFQDFKYRKHLTGTIYEIFLINKNNTAVPIQKIEGYRKYGRKYVFTESEAINFIAGMNYSFKLDQDLNPVEAWVNALQPINLTGIITAPYLSKIVENYLNGEDFNDVSLLYRRQKVSGNTSAVATVKKISSVVMGDFRRFCFGSMRQIEFGDINLFYGANGSGKTSILEALEYGFTAEIHRMKDFKIKYGNDRYPRISVVSDDGSTSVFTPATSKKISKEIERVWYGVPTGRTKTTLNEQFNRFNYFDSEAAYKFIHAKDQNDEAFEDLFSNLLFGEQIVGYEKKWKRFKQAFDESYSKIREELNSAEFWVGIYRDALTRTSGGTIDVSPVYKEGSRLYLTNLHRGQDATLDRLKAIKEDLDAIAPIIEKFKTSINFEPGMSFSLIMRALRDRKAESEKLQQTIENLKKDVTALSARRNQYLDNMQKYKAESAKVEAMIKDLEYAYAQFCRYRPVIEHPEQIQRLSEYEKDLSRVSKDMETIRLVDTSSSIQYLLSVSDIALLSPDDRHGFEVQLKENQSQLLLLREEYRKIQEKNNQRKNDMLSLQKEGISFLQKYGTATCPLCGEKYRSLDELRNHIETTEGEQADNTQLLKDISRLEDVVTELQALIRHDDKLKMAFKELDRVQLSDADLRKDRKVAFIKALYSRKDEKEQRKKELEALIRGLSNQGIDRSSIIKAATFTEHNKTYLQYASESAGKGFEEYYIDRTKILSQKAEEIKTESEKARRSAQEMEAQIDSKQRAISAAQNSDIQNKYINVRNLHQMLLPLKTKFSMPDTLDLHQWVLDFDAFTLTVSQYIDKISSSTNVELEKQQAMEYQQQAKRLKVQLQRCEKAVNALNRMPSLKTFVTDTVQANIQRISYYFRWMHHSGEFESLGIDEVGVYAIRGVDNRLVRVYEMSTGQRTSLAFSVMLAFYSVADTAPKCLLLDEPLATMDNVQVANALDILKSLADQGTQLFFTSASLDTIKLFQNFFRNSFFDYREFEFVKRINGTVKINNNQFASGTGNEPEEVDVEALYIRFEHSLADIIKMYPNTLATKAQLQGILKDIFPGETVRVNLLLQAYEQGIFKEIASAPAIHSPFAYKFKKRLIENYGISNEYADWTVTVWCIAYGSLVLNKTCEVKNPVTHI